MSAHPSFSRKERVRLFALYAGRCYLCEGAIHAAEAWDVEHVIAWELSRDNSDENLRLAHRKCHKAKTANDIRAIRKSDRIRDRHSGAMPRSRNPMPGSRASGWKKKINGTTEKRPT